MRAALESRIVGQARDMTIEPGRLRRRFVFQRVLRRLSEDPGWVLKGGYLLESRLAGGARTTRDLDLANAGSGEEAEFRRALERPLAPDPDGDFLEFAVARAIPLRTDLSGRGGWRFGLTATLAGRTFDRVRLDVAERVAEVAGGTEILEIASPVRGVGLAPARVTAVDVAQHAAEKFHALCRLYAGGRPSTRVKDLVDLVLLAEAGLLPDARLGTRLRSVFAVRDGTDPPKHLPDPPAAWDSDYPVMIAGLEVACANVASAMVTARQLYRDALC